MIADLLPGSPLVSLFFIFLREKKTGSCSSRRYSSVRNCPILHFAAGGGGGGGEAVSRYLQFQDCHCQCHSQSHKIQYQMNKFTYTIPNILGRKDRLDCDNNCHFWNFPPTRCSARDSISGKHCMNSSRCVLQGRHGSISIVQSWQLLWERWRSEEMQRCLAA